MNYLCAADRADVFARVKLFIVFVVGHCVCPAR